jgi:hypothetical protein
METFQYVMYGFYAVLMIAAIGMVAWLYNKRKEGDR